LGRGTPVVGAAYIMIAAIAVVAIDLRIVLVPAATASLLLFVGGLLIFRRHRAALILPWPASEDEGGSSDVVIIDGVELPLQSYEQELIVAFRSRHIVELVGCCVVAAAALYFMLFSSLLREEGAGDHIGAYQAELICGAGLGILLANLRWFSERRILCSSHFTVGTVVGAGESSNRRWVTYQFFDASRDRRGGREYVWTRSYGNAVLVLFNPNNPDSNTVHCASLFHEFRFCLMPSRNRRQPAIETSA